MPFIQDLGNSVLNAAASRVSKRIGKIARTRKFIANGRGFLAETKSRLREFSRRQEAIRTEYADIGLERVIGDKNDILSIEFLEAGLLAAKSIGRINVMFGTEYGSGFHVGNKIIITNHHVVRDKDQARASEFELNVEENKLGPAKNVFTFSLDPDRFFLTSSKLDYTLVAVNDHVDGNSSINDFGWHALLNVQGKIRVGDPVNIVQHPNGNDKAVVVHNSHFLHLENGTDIEEFCWYSGDTKEGSSGSPVFNNRWEVIALHHQSVPETNRRGRIVDRNGRAMSKRRLNENPEDIAWVANEGIRISRIFQSIQNASIDDSDQCKIRDDLIALWSAPAAQKRGQRAAENKRHE